MKQRRLAPLTIIHDPKPPTLWERKSEDDMADIVGDITPEKAPGNGNLMPPWQPGQSGNPNGRPKGARQRLGEAFLQAVLEDFEESGGAKTTMGKQAIKEMREQRPHEYAKMIAGFQAKELDANISGDLSDEMKRWLGIG